MRKQRAEGYLVGIKTVLDLLLTASDPLWYINSESAKSFKVLCQFKVT